MLYFFAEVVVRQVVATGLRMDLWTQVLLHLSTTFLQGEGVPWMATTTKTPQVSLPLKGKLFCAHCGQVPYALSTTKFKAQGVQ